MHRELKDCIVAKFTFDEIHAYYNDVSKEQKLLYFFSENWCEKFKKSNPDIDIQYLICYNSKTVLMFREVQMRVAVTVEIPYGNHSDYVGIIWQINNMVGSDGMVLLAVNNNPYDLKSYLVVEDNQESDEIIQLIIKNKMKLNMEKGLKEILLEMGNKMWNIQTFPQRVSKEDIRMIMDPLYIFREKTDLIEKGYFDEVKKPKIFVSYSHKNEDIVMKVYQYMQMAGMNIWIDLQAIDVGDIIPKKMLDGVRESDYAVLFLSKEYKESMMAKAELQHMLYGVFTEQKKWYPIKLDDVNVEEIQSGLGNYKYYDYQKNSDLDNLISDMSRVFKLD
ncbi:MAG: toll/interleukin-1 receptor domain-containing protein [Lachnospiraceae bacterium]